MILRENVKSGKFIFFLQCDNLTRAEQKVLQKLAAPVRLSTASAKAGDYVTSARAVPATLVAVIAIGCADALRARQFNLDLFCSRGFLK